MPEITKPMWIFNRFTSTICKLALGPRTAKDVILWRAAVSSEFRKRQIDVL
jgi:hypothetical protein